MGKKFQCSTCNKPFKTSRGCAEHISTVHTKKGGDVLEKVNLATYESPKMSAKDAMDFAESCDLPDGAYWAMVEELSGCEPADCI